MKLAIANLKYWNESRVTPNQMEIACLEAFEAGFKAARKCIEPES